MNDFEKIKAASESRILIASHRGISGGNIPPNTLEAFEAGMRSGADIIECDVQKLADGTLVMFHPWTERESTSMKPGEIGKLTYEELMNHKYYNICKCRTQYGFYTLDEALEYMKGRCYINLDKCWECLPDIMKVVRRHKIEEQILLKSDPEERYLAEVEELAPDVNYMPVYRGKDIWTENILSRNINFFGAELVYEEPDNILSSDEYIEKMHKLGKKLWINAIVFDHKRVLAGGHTDDLAMIGDPDGNWGWMADKGYDIIQTDWPSQLRNYLEKSGKYNKK